MTRQIVLAPFALLLTSLTIGFATAPALAGEIHYRAEPAAAVSEARLVAGGLAWKCGAVECVTRKSDSRPIVDCQALARRVGPLRNFTVAGRALAADELEKCNGRAR